MDDSTESGYHSLQDLALHRDLIYSSDDSTRIYKMYEDFYDGFLNYADKLVSDALTSRQLATYTVPVLMKALIQPQYAIRAFFAAADACVIDVSTAQTFWDQGAAVLVGSIEAADVGGEGSSNGMSWYALGKEFCEHFKCGDGVDEQGVYEQGDYKNPPALRKMMDNVELGRQAISKSDCTLVLKKVRAMESLLLVPIIQGVLYHSAKRQQTGEDSHYGAAWAFGKAVLPVLNVRSRSDAEVIADTLFTPGNYEAADLWTAMMLSLPDFGIECEDIGEDTMGILGGQTFCNHIENATEFPTPAPNPTTTRVPTRLPTISPTAEDASDEINAAVIGGYQFTNHADAESK